MREITVFIIGLLLFGCTSPETVIDNKPVSLKDLAFKKFVARQKFVDLPIHFDLDYISDSLTQPKIVDDSDTLFIPIDLAQGRIWGIYRDTSKYFLFIILGQAAVYIPEIIVFDKHGNKIDGQDLLVAGCGADCGYYCNAISNIYKDSKTSDINFYARDSVFYYTCDSVSKPVPGTFVHYVEFVSGSINSSGKITKRTGKTDFLE